LAETEIELPSPRLPELPALTAQALVEAGAMVTGVSVRSGAVFTENTDLVVGP
jgi:hypothetical protein